MDRVHSIPKLIVERLLEEEASPLIIASIDELFFCFYSTYWGSGILDLPLLKAKFMSASKKDVEANTYVFVLVLVSVDILTAF